MKKLWIYRVAVVLLAAGLAVAVLSYRRDAEAEPSPALETTGWREIEPSVVEDNFVKLLHENMGLLTVGEEGNTNSMTIGWGSFGTLWGMPVFNDRKPEENNGENINISLSKKSFRQR